MHGHVGTLVPILLLLLPLLHHAAALGAEAAAGTAGGSPPSDLTVSSSSSSSATLRWAAPAELLPRSSVLTVHRQYEVPSHRGQWFEVAELPANATGFTVPGLLERQRYTFRVCAGAACSVTASTVTQAVESTTPRGMVIAAANATYPRQGEGTIVRDGHRLLYFYARFTDGHDVGASAIVFRVSETNGTSWSEPTQITPPDGKGRANPGASVLAPGHIVLSYFVGVNHSSAVRVYRHSLNCGASWEPERMMSDGSYSYMTGAHDRQRVLSNGRIIIMIHGHDGPHGKVAFPLATIVFFSDDNATTWQRSATPLQANMTDDLVGGEHGFWETALVETQQEPGGHLLMLGRTCSGWLAESRSTDFGKPENVRLFTCVSPAVPPRLSVQQ